jgi:homoserine kinase type II
MKEENIKEILSNYNLGRLIKFKPYKRGNVQLNLFIQTTRGKYTLRYYKSRSLTYVKSEIKLLEKLKKYKLPVQSPVKNKKNKVINTYNKKPYVLFHYIEGKHVNSKSINKTQIINMTQMLARHHEVIRGYKTPNYKSREIHHKRYILSQVRIASKRKDIQIKKSVDLVRKELKNIQLPSNLPKGTIHGDYNLGNILFQGNKIVAILDFDDSSYEHLLLDLSDLINNYCFLYNKHSFDHKRAKLIIETYCKIRPLNTTEKNNLKKAMLFRYLLFSTWNIAYGSKKDIKPVKGLSAMLRKFNILKQQKINY